MLDTRLCRALELHALAKKILAIHGHLIMSPDGIFYWIYRDDDIRIELQLAIAGASMPSWLDIWSRGEEKFQMITFQHRRDGRPEVLLGRRVGGSVTSRCHPMSGPTR
jgi:hypothetical protein